MPSTQKSRFMEMQRVKVHDRFSIEIKLSLVPSKKQPVSTFSLNAWFFFPKSLDINSLTYSKLDFYRDLKSNLRLITPVFTLQEIATAGNSPLSLLRSAVKFLDADHTRSGNANIEHHTRMFLSILKSSLRDETDHIHHNIRQDNATELVGEYISAVRDITRQYRDLLKHIRVPAKKQGPFSYHAFGDEFMSNIIEHRTFRLLSQVKGKDIPGIDSLSQSLSALIDSETEYRKKAGYPVVERDSRDHNRKLLSRLGILKKFMVSELFLNAVRRREGVVIEQVYYSLAAGISMIFATAVAFSFQQKYGNMTMPFFVALVVSYMLKDRIKELFRYYFAHRPGNRYFDQKTSITLKSRKIGTDREAVDFISHEKVPAEVIGLRARTSVFDEYARQFADSILLYRKLIRLNRENLEKVSSYNVPGIHEILRINILNYIRNMDDAEIPLFVADEEKGFDVIRGEKVYYLNLVIQIRQVKKTEYVHYRIVMNRNGLLAVEKI